MKDPKIHQCAPPPNEYHIVLMIDFPRKDHNCTTHAHTDALILVFQSKQGNLSHREHVCYDSMDIKANISSMLDV